MSSRLPLCANKRHGRFPKHRDLAYRDAGGGVVHSIITGSQAWTADCEELTLPICGSDVYLRCERMKAVKGLFCAVTMNYSRLNHSDTVSPEPPSSAGKSFSLGSPSFIGRTVSA